MPQFVAIYHPDIPSTVTTPKLVSLAAVDDWAARGWLLVNPNVTPPTSSLPYYTRAETLSQVGAGTGPLGGALRAAFEGWAEDLELGGGSGAEPTGAVAAPAAISSYYVKEETNAAVYSFPARLRPAEPGRQRVRVRNKNTVSCQVAYSVNDNGNTNSPDESQWTAGATLAPGQAADFTGHQAIFCRPLNNNGTDGLKVTVETTLAVL